MHDLKDSFGNEIILFDEQGESTAYRILAEFEHESLAYAVIQSKELQKEGEVAIFRIVRNEDGAPELETIEDDDEWETVSELYDEMTVPSDLE
nr:DUF1292 domain-containing protein [Paenibacillus turpanensis]